MARDVCVARAARAMPVGFVLSAHSSGARHNSSGARHNPFDLRVQSITVARSELLPGAVGLKRQPHAAIAEQTTIAGARVWVTREWVTRGKS